MSRWTASFGLPLLGKELIEQAARKRTYVIRVLYAGLLFFASFLTFYNTLQIGTVSPLAALGQGREMFMTLVSLQFVGIYVFMPAITCGVLTQEKERASLQLLFLTRLGPWTILFEKLASRMVPMLSFLLLSLPLLAFAYSLGGISPESLISGVWLLLISAIQMGTLAMMCSAYFRTTVGAYVGACFLQVGMVFGPYVAWMLACAFSNDGENLMWRVIETINRGGNSIASQLPTRTTLEWPFVGMAAFMDGHRMNFGAASGLSVLLARAIQTFPILISSALFLSLARLFVVRRAFVPPRNRILDLFKALDLTFARLNENRWTKGIILLRDAAALPVDEPVAWRETTKRSLGRARYLFRVFVAIEAPLAVLCILTAFAGAASDGNEGSYLMFLFWAVAVLLVAVQSASLVAGERMQQTLDVLCTTPLSSREIIRQKFRGVRRLMIVLLVPFGTVLLFQAWWKSEVSGMNTYTYVRHTFNLPLYLACSALSVAIYLPMVAWMSLWIGLKVRTQGRAILGSLAAIVGWCVAPLVFCVMPLAMLYASTGSLERSNMALTLLVSPAMIIILNELGGLRDLFDAPWVAVATNFIGYGIALAVFRSLCLNHADRLLGRLESK